MPVPRVSLIIPTYGRERELVETIASLEACEYPAESWELIVVDQTAAHTADVADFLARAAAQERIRLFAPPDVDFASLTKARNYGIAKADRPEVIIFVDDDVEVGPGFIAAHVAAYADPAVGATVGRVVVPGRAPEWHPGAPVGLITWFGDFVNNYDATEAAESGNFIGCNFSLRASVLAKTGGFDESFMGNALREDSDMAVRVRAASYRIAFLPNAQALHKEAKSGGTRSQTDRTKWYYALFYNNFLFYAKWAPLWRVPFFVAHMARPILACWLWYGKGRLEAFLAPWRGIRDGIRAARRSRRA